MNPITENELSSYRPIPFYYITSHNPDELTYEAFYQDLADMKEKGYGGVIPFNRPPEGFSQDLYFTEAWFSMLENCIRACHDLGLRVWLNDDYDAPPGTIGGRLEKIAPHLQPQKLGLQEDGTVVVEEVPWGFPAFEDPESASLFQQYVYEEYKRRFGKYFGNTIVGFFSDADSRRVNSMVYTPGSPMKDYFPWSKNFAESFKVRYGYDIWPYLPSILRREVSLQSRDYWEHSGELYMSWFQSNYEWCQKNGLEYTFHTSDSAPFRIETSYFNSAFAEGKAIDAGAHCDWPGTDHEWLDLNGGRLMLLDRYQMTAAFWGGDDSMRRCENFYDVYADLRAKQAQSCAYLHDKKGVMCEMYAGVNWNASYKDLRNIAAWQVMQGVNFIVLQAYHYKLRGDTKFFAPLSFGRHSHTDFNMKAFNDMLTDYAYRCCRGRLQVDFALLDPTDSIWEGIGDSWEYLELAKKLNHFPHGYVLSDIKGLKRKAHELKAVINPGLPLREEERAAIAALGLPILESNEITTVQDMELRFPCGIRWEGNGNVMFMRRYLENGETLVIAGNIEQEETLIGTLRIGNCAYEIELTSGELAFFGGGYDSYRVHKNEKQRIHLSENAHVNYEKTNIIPLTRWEDEHGRGFSLKQPATRVSFILVENWKSPHFDALNEPVAEYPRFPFVATQAFKDLELLISDRFLSRHVNSVFLNGAELQSTEKTFILDDSYTVFRFDIEKGMNYLGLHMISHLDTDNTQFLTDDMQMVTDDQYYLTEDELFLRGDFGAEIRTWGDEACYGGAFLTNLQQYILLNAEVKLSQRPETLRTDLSWAEQRNPFYSGYVDYHFTVKLEETLHKAELIMPELRDAAFVWIDNVLSGELIAPPYHLPVSLSAGVHQIRIRVANTLGNMLDGYRAPSGLCARPYIATYSD